MADNPAGQNVLSRAEGLYAETINRHRRYHTEGDRQDYIQSRSDLERRLNNAVNDYQIQIHVLHMDFEQLTKAQARPGAVFDASQQALYDKTYKLIDSAMKLNAELAEYRAVGAILGEADNDKAKDAERLLNGGDLFVGLNMPNEEMREWFRFNIVDQILKEDLGRRQNFNVSLQRQTIQNIVDMEYGEYDENANEDERKVAPVPRDIAELNRQDALAKRYNSQGRPDLEKEALNARDRAFKKVAGEFGELFNQVRNGERSRAESLIWNKLMDSPTIGKPSAMAAVHSHEHPDSDPEYEHPHEHPHEDGDSHEHTESEPENDPAETKWQPPAYAVAGPEELAKMQMDSLERQLLPSQQERQPVGAETAEQGSERQENDPLPGSDTGDGSDNSNAVDGEDPALNTGSNETGDQQNEQERVSDPEEEEESEIDYSEVVSGLKQVYDANGELSAGDILNILGDSHRAGYDADKAHDVLEAFIKNNFRDDFELGLDTDIDPANPANAKKLKNLAVAAALYDIADGDPEKMQATFESENDYSFIANVESRFGGALDALRDHLGEHHEQSETPQTAGLTTGTPQQDNDREQKKDENQDPELPWIDDETSKGIAAVVAATAAGGLVYKIARGVKNRTREREKEAHIAEDVKKELQAEREKLAKLQAQYEEEQRLGITDRNDGIHRTEDGHKAYLEDLQRQINEAKADLTEKERILTEEKRTGKKAVKPAAATQAQGQSQPASDPEKPAGPAKPADTGELHGPPKPPEPELTELEKLNKRMEEMRARATGLGAAFEAPAPETLIDDRSIARKRRAEPLNYSDTEMSMVQRSRELHNEGELLKIEDDLLREEDRALKTRRANLVRNSAGSHEQTDEHRELDKLEKKFKIYKDSHDARVEAHRKELDDLGRALKKHEQRGKDLDAEKSRIGKEQDDLNEEFQKYKEGKVKKNGQFTDIKPGEHEMTWRNLLERRVQLHGEGMSHAEQRAVYDGAKFSLLSDRPGQTIQPWNGARFSDVKLGRGAGMGLGTWSLYNRLTGEEGRKDLKDEFGVATTGVLADITGITADGAEILQAGKVSHASQAERAATKAAGVVRSLATTEEALETTARVVGKVKTGSKLLTPVAIAATSVSSAVEIELGRRKGDAGRAAGATGTLGGGLAGAGAGALLGMKLGGTIGTFFGGPAGTVVGGGIGGVVGGIGGALGGGYIGEKVGRMALTSKFSSWLGIDDELKKAAEAGFSAELTRRYDRNHDNKLDLDEIKEGLRKNGIEALRDMDQNKDGLTNDELKRGLDGSLGRAKEEFGKVTEPAAIAGAPVGGPKPKQGT